jgi:hypothetical protein
MAFVPYDLPNLLLERWYFGDDCVSHNVVVYTEVVVYQSISHSCDGSAVDVAVLMSEFCRNVLRGFTDNFQTADKGSFQCFVSYELFFAQPLYLVGKVCTFVQDMRRYSSDGGGILNLAHDVRTDVGTERLYRHQLNTPLK